MDCSTCARLLPAYGDNELGVESAVEVECHVRQCAACRDRLQRQRTFSSVVNRLYPRVSLPPNLDERVRRALRSGPGSRVWLHTLALAASVLVVLAAAWMLARPTVSGAPATVVAVAQVYRSARQHALPLALQSSDAAAVDAWLGQHLSFPIAALTHPTGAITLQGASVVELAGERAGYVQYRRDGRPISLFLLPPRAWPASGRRLQVRDVDFHLYTIDGFKLIAWNHPPLSYVLASDLGGNGGDACAVCHSNVADAGIALPNDGGI
jgi:anti-sigma factor RsiW